MDVHGAAATGPAFLLLLTRERALFLPLRCRVSALVLSVVILRLPWPPAQGSSHPES